MEISLEALDFAAITENRIEFRGISVLTIALDDLIRMKRATNRKQDRDDVTHLEKVKDARKKGRF